jgi:flagellar motility protein MotE (MotC chaperone)
MFINPFFRKQLLDEKERKELALVKNKYKQAIKEKKQEISVLKKEMKAMLKLVKDKYKDISLDNDSVE